MARNPNNISVTYKNLVSGEIVLDYIYTVYIYWTE